jgi:hypothetical protein
VRPTRLQTRPAVENDHDILAEIASLLRLSFAQSLARRHHKHNRHNAPGNPEHRQKCA